MNKTFTEWIRISNDKRKSMCKCGSLNIVSFKFYFKCNDCRIEMFRSTLIGSEYFNQN